ncbi:GEVED domain-containing protein [Streptomyces sp. NBC_00006]|uniref:DUF7927 domain-containing protein n=1 Tax=unclassified Streptomyces TaxID=2593676 RepID=UPI00225ABCE0|nr:MULTISPECIES: GEVED domain-containing protein [unclassified Streptomyces]MCX5532756.1 GEVED domain-containing protein [Streptomyces sp. NBC_00006]
MDGPRQWLRRWRVPRRASAAGVVLGAVLAMVAAPLPVVEAAGASAAGEERAAAAPGTPADPTELFKEDFENDPPEGARLLTDHVGGPPRNMTYKADSGWLEHCNGWVLNKADSEGYAPGVKSCRSQASWWNIMRDLADVLGQYNGSADSAENHGLGAYTDNPGPGAKKVQFETAKTIQVPANRFLTFGATAVATGTTCYYGGPKFRFYAMDGQTALPASSKVMDPCTATDAQTIDRNEVAKLTADTPVLFPGSQLGVRMTNDNGSPTGNDHAVDDIRVLDVSPQIDKAFDKSTMASGGATKLTFTVTNTSDLLAKKGWSFTDSLPGGMTVADPASATTTCTNGVATATPGGSSVQLKGDLTAGQRSCTLSVNVTAKKAGAYKNCAENLADVKGLKPPTTCATVTVDEPPVPTEPRSICTDTVYLNQGTPSGASLFTVDLATGAQTPLPGEPRVGGSIAYSRLNGNLYVIPGPADTLTRVDPATGQKVETALTGFPSGGRTKTLAANLAGTRAYAIDHINDKLVTVDIDPGSSTYSKVLSARAFNFAPGDVADIALNPVDGWLYGVDESTGNLRRFNPQTAEVQRVTAGTYPKDTFGGVFFDSLGNFYAVRNSDGAVYHYDMTTSTAESPIQESELGKPKIVSHVDPTTGGNDGAACLRPHEYGDAPDSYGTSKAKGGASSVADPARLTLGRTVTAEVDARTPLDATGDDDDALSTVPPVPAEAATYGLKVPVNNKTGKAATLAGWVDFDRNGTFDAGERVTVPVQADATSAELNWSGLTGRSAGDSYLRLRLYEGTVADPKPTGAFDGVGEIEDHPVTIEAPEPKSSMKITKSSDKTEVEPGGTLTYTVKIANTGETALKDQTVTDDLSKVLDDAALEGEPTASSGTLNVAGTTATWTGDIPLGDTVTLTYKVKAKAAGSGDGTLTNKVTGPPISNCSALEGTAGPASRAAADPDCTTTAELTALEIAKSADKEDAKPGDKVTYTVKVANTGKTAYQGAEISDDLTKVLDDATYNDDAKADSGAVSYTEPKMTWKGDLKPGDSATITYSVTVKNPARGDKKLVNSVSGPPGSNCAEGSQDAKCTTSVPMAALEIFKAPTNAYDAGPGSKVEYTVYIRNVGPADYDDATVVDDLSDVIDDAKYNDDVSSARGKVSYEKPKLTWTGDIRGRSTVSFTYSATVDAPITGDFDMVNVVTGTPDTNCGPDSEDPQCRVDIPLRGLEIAKTSDADGSVEAGDKVTYTVTLSNPGKADYEGAKVTDDLTKVLDDATYNGDANSVAGELSYKEPKLTWSGDVPAGKKRTFTYSVTVGSPPEGDKKLVNAVTGPPDSSCPEGSDDPKCSTSTPVKGLEIVKTAEPKEGKAGDKVTYTVTVSNTGGVAYDGAKVTDDLSKVLDDAKYNGDAKADSGSVSYAKPELTWTGDLKPGAKATITYSVKVDTPVRGDKLLDNKVTGPPGSNCEEGSTDPKCSTTTGLGSLRYEKTSSAPDDAVPGSDVTYKVTVTNTGKAEYKDATFTDDLSKVLDDAKYNGDAKADSGSVSYAKPELTWTGDLKPGGKATVTYSVKVGSPPKGDKKLTNQIVGTPGSNCAEGSDDPKCTTSHGIPAVDFAKSSDAGDSVKPGGKVRYTVTVTNTGKATAKGATFTDDLSKVLDDAKYNGDASAGSGELSYDKPKLTWAGDVAAGAKVTVKYSVTVGSPPEGDKKLTNAVTSDTPGSNCPPDSDDPKCTTTDSVATLKIKKSSDNSEPLPGDKVTYTVAVTNESKEADYPGAKFSDDLTGLLDDAKYNGDAEATAGKTSYDKPELAWTGNVAAGATVTLTYSVTVQDPPEGDKLLKNAVTSTSPGTNCPEGTKDPDCSTEAGVPSLKIKKTVQPEKPRTGDTLSYKVTVRNDGEADHPDATFTDDLSKVLDDADYNGDAKADSGRVSYAEPKLTWTGDLAKGATATVTYSFTVTGPRDGGDGKYVNGVEGPGSNCPPDSTDPDCTTVLPKPSYDFGDAPDSYGTVRKNQGAYHEIVDGLRIGSEENAENDGTPHRDARSASDDDGLGTVTLYQHQDSYTAKVPVTNTTGEDAELACWLDKNENGTFEPDEMVRTTVPDGATEATLELHGLDTMKASTTFARLRIFGDDSEASANRALAAPRDMKATGFGGPGEVEDHMVRVEPTHLEIAKSSDASDSVKPGDKVTYTVTVGSSGPAEYTGATFTDDLTEVLDDAEYNGDAEASAGDVSYAKPEVTWNGTVPAGKKVTVTYSVTVGDPVKGDRKLTNAVTGPDGSTCEPGSTDPDCNTTTDVPEPPTPTDPSSPSPTAPPTTPNPQNPDPHTPQAPNADQPHGELPGTGSAATTWALGIAAALALGLGVLVTVAVRRRRNG